MTRLEEIAAHHAATATSHLTQAWNWYRFSLGIVGERQRSLALLCHRCPLPPTSNIPASPTVDQEASEAPPADVASLLDMPLTEAKRRAASDFERRYLVRVMELAMESVSEGARRSGLDRTNFRRLLQRHGLR